MRAILNICKYTYNIRRICCIKFIQNTHIFRISHGYGISGEYMCKQTNELETNNVSLLYRHNLTFVHFPINFIWKCISDDEMENFNKYFQMIKRFKTDVFTF